MKVRPIRNEDDLEAAVEEIGRLWGAAPGSDEGDRLEVLVILVDAYERQRHPILPPDPIEAIRFVLDQRGLTERDLQPLIGSRTRVYEVLTGRRPLTLRMIRNLSRALALPADVLLGTEAAQRSAPASRLAADDEVPRRARVRRRIRRPKSGYRSPRREGGPHPVRYGAKLQGDA
jgi:HTH-type transcriptional regulator/antitoxin HigA